MIYPIQSLETAMILTILCLPIGLGVNVSYFLSGVMKRKKISTNYLGLIISYSSILIIAFFSGIVHLKFIHIWPNVLGILAAIMSGIGCICIEYFVGVLMTFVSTGQWVSKFSVHSVYSETKKIDIWDIMSVGAFVILEELIFRMSIINVLFELKVPLVLIAIIAIFVFALNHSQWGLFTIIQKLFSGCIFVILYLMFDNNILIPIIAHCVQNYTLLWLSRSERFAMVGGGNIR